MDCLVKIYDNEQINNLISVMSLRPKKVIFLYDANESKKENLENLEEACISCIPDLNFEFASINSQDLDDISKKCKRIIHSNPKAYFDITGGEELFVIGVYLACTKNFIPIFKLDTTHETILNIYGCKHLEGDLKIPHLGMDVLLKSKGACISGDLHPTPPKELFKPILEFCGIIFNNIPVWKELCLYIQGAIKKFNPDQRYLNFSAPKKLGPDVKGQFSEGATTLLEKAFNLGLINNLSILDSTVSFSFAFPQIKKYMTDFGSWLELYSYINILKSELFSDVRTSVRIVWNSHLEKRLEITNEIDGTFFHGFHPVFISCKLCDPTAESLNELSVYPRYFGGKYSKCIMVTMGNTVTVHPKLTLRASEMNINIIDYNDIISGNFIKRIKHILGIKDS